MKTQPEGIHKFGNCLCCSIIALVVYSHCLTPGPRPRPGPGQVLCRTFHIAPGLGQGPGRMACMVLIRAFHIAPGPGPGQGPGKTLLSYDPSGPGTFSGPENGYSTHLCSSQSLSLSRSRSRCNVKGSYQNHTSHSSRFRSRSRSRSRSKTV